jgi:hypothetical protein
MRTACSESIGVFLRDVGCGMLEISHNTLALLGLCVVAAVLFAATRADLRHSLEQHALDWLLERQEARESSAGSADLSDLAEPSAGERATAADPGELPRQQAAVAHWLARRYKVAPEPVSRLVQEAWSVGQRMGVEPTLVLAVMAIESSFNPFAQSPVGAQGLMQVLTRVHDDKYQPFGGVRAAFDPITNLKVGVQILKECIQRAGSLEAGLRQYVGASTSDGGYASKVLAEQSLLRTVAEGRTVSISATMLPGKSASPAEQFEPTPVADTPVSPASAVPRRAGGEQVALLRN